MLSGSLNKLTLSLYSALVILPSASATVNGPVINQNFPDPSIITVSNTTFEFLYSEFGQNRLFYSLSNRYAFATNSGGINIQMAQSTDNGANWSIIESDALPDVGSWAVKGKTWAPDVINRGDGTFVMCMSMNSLSHLHVHETSLQIDYAAQNPSQGTHCIGTATSTSVTGPYTPRTQPVVCATSAGGAIDPAGFQDTNGTRYIVYKEDGGHLGGGGPCGNADGSHPTPIMLQKMDSDAITPVDSPVKILDRGEADGPLIEAPSLILRDGTYILFFSSNCYNTILYDISYATAANISGPYTKAAKPFKMTGDDNLTAPGGLDAKEDGSFAVSIDHDNSDL